MHAEANRDFTEMLSVMGVSLAYVDAISHGSADMIEFPSGDWNYVTGPSEIQGTGGFTTKAAQSGDLLAPARRTQRRTPAGRYTNHAPTPNARMREDGDDLDLVAVCDIAAGEEITIDYRQVFTERGLDWRTALRAPTPDEIGERLASLHGGRAPHEVSASIHDLLTNMLADTANHRAMHTEHVIADGMYLRKLFIPKETLVVGKIHLMTALNIVATGDVTILTQFGTKRLKAGFTGVSKAGIQKVAWAHEDTVFINVFRTDLTDLAAIEAAIAQDITQGELGCL